MGPQVHQAVSLLVVLAVNSAVMGSEWRWVGRELGNLTSFGAFSWLVKYCHFPCGCNYAVQTFGLFLVILYQHQKKFPFWAHLGLLTSWMMQFQCTSHQSADNEQKTGELISFRPSSEKWMDSVQPILKTGQLLLTVFGFDYTTTCTTILLQRSEIRNIYFYLQLSAA